MNRKVVAVTILMLGLESGMASAGSAPEMEKRELPESAWSYRAPIRFASRLAIDEGTVLTRHGAPPRPLSLVAADLDGDGVPDLVSGWSDGALGGQLRFHRGNVDAIYPSSRDAMTRRSAGTFLESPFFPSTPLLELSSAPDFLIAGDFDADGLCDLAAATRDGEQLIFLRGNGKGALTLSGVRPLNGRLTSLLAADVNRPDGLVDILAGVVDGDGARLLVFEAGDGAIRSLPESIELPASASAIEAGRFEGSGEFVDIAVASGDRLVLVQGRDRRLVADPERKRSVPVPRVDVIDTGLDVDVVSMTAGHFVVSGESTQELALLDATGEIRNLGVANASRCFVERARWASRAASKTVCCSVLVRSVVSSGDRNDLAVYDRGSGRLRLFSIQPEEPGEFFEIASRVSAGTVALIPMRLNSDALSDFVTLGEGPSPLSVDLSAPMATFVVTTDTGTGTGSLDWAIRQANINPGADLITFDIPAPAGLPTITRTGMAFQSLPAVTGPVTIDGTTEPVHGLVALEGCCLGRTERAARTVPAGPTVDTGFGILLGGGASVVRGLVILEWERGIKVGLAGNCILEGNFVGTLPGGSAEAGNYDNGILVDRAPDNTIGGTTPAARNVVAGTFFGPGIEIYGAASTDNLIAANTVGLLPDETGILGNGGAGIRLNGAGANNRVGGSAAAANVIGGNFGAGVEIKSSSGALVQSNYIGTNAAGLDILGNFLDGVRPDASSNTTLGGSSPALRNVISGNHSHGVEIVGTSTGTLVVGNIVGLVPSGDAALPNGADGILAGEETSLTTIGGTVAGAGNTISGNAGDGLEIAATAGAVAQGNVIGTNVAATLPLGNIGSGVRVTAPALSVQIGGPSGGSGNIIAANHYTGVYVSGECTLLGNFIGTTPALVAGLGNADPGVFVAIDGWATIGGALPGEGNVIAFNSSGSGGVFLEGLSGPGFTIAEATIRGNSIFQNAGLGIDLGPVGVTPNDPFEQFLGPNHYQNFPDITSALWNGATTTVSGILNSLASESFLIDVYSSVAADLPSGYGEGQTWAGTVTATTNAGRYASWTFVTSANLSFQKITATATRATGHTSEFSQAAAVTFVSPIGESAPLGDLKFIRGSGTSIDVVYAPACGATSHVIYRGSGPITGDLAWNTAWCLADTSGLASIDPGDPAVGGVDYFVIAGQNATAEGSYGKDSAGNEGREATGLGACDRPRVLGGNCP